MAEKAKREAKRCRCVPAPDDSEKYCIKCGARNPDFSMKAFRHDMGEGTKFGADCANDHIELRKAVLEYPEFPFCAYCGWKAPVPPQQTESRT